jgi:small subunit ribosomal protein S1
MVVINENPVDESAVDLRDEGWWESVLSDEQHISVASSGRDGARQIHERPNGHHHVHSGEQSVPPAARHTASAPSHSNHHHESHHTKAPSQPESIAILTPADWANAEQIYKQDQIVTLTVTNYNRGGLLVESSSLQGFVPYSHLVDMTCQNDQEREHFLAQYVGRDLRLKIIECIPEKGRVVFSERSARSDAGRRPQLFSSLQVGDVTEGEVTNITDFGAFVDLGGVEGLIHISELSWGRVLHPSNVLKLGQKIEVQVLEILLERCRIALSVKRLKPNPWETITERYTVNDVVPAVITSVASFGVFARLDEGLEGLVHISEMEPEGLVVKETFAEGQRINVRILHIEAQHHRLGLSLKPNESEADALSTSLPG